MDKMKWVIITPQKIDFGEILVGSAAEHEMSVRIQNIRKTAIKLNFKHGYKTFDLACDEDDVYTTIASGLSKTVKVILKPDTIKDISTETLCFKVDEQLFQIPVTARPCQPRLRVEGDLNFGEIISTAKIISKTIKLINISALNVTFRIVNTATNSKTTFNRNFGKLKPGGSVEFIAEIVADGIMTFNEEVKIEVDSKTHYLLISKGSIVNEEIQFLDKNGNDLKTIDLGLLYNMTKSHTHGTLYNNSPRPLEWVSVHLNGAVGSELGLFDKTPDLIEILPSEGVLNAYERKEIKIVLNPKKTISKIESLVTFFQFSIVSSSGGFIDTDVEPHTVPGKNQMLEIGLKATIHPLTVDLYVENELLDDAFDFGSININSIKAQNIRITNLSEHLPIKMDFEQMSHFTVHPRSICIPQKSEWLVELFFTPRQVGPLLQKLAINYRHGSQKVARRNIELNGRGIIEPPKNTFQTKEKYITNLNEYNPEFTFTPAEREKELQRKKAHDEQIRLTIKQRSIKRKEDELGIEEFHENLNLSCTEIRKNELPKKKDDILLQSRLTTAQDQSNQRRLELQVYIENGKLWPSLRPSELHQITITPRDLDFQDVALKSIARKKLSINNNFIQDILFQLDISCAELNQSHPLSVVIPAQSSVELPVLFESEKIGPFKTSIQYIVNKCFKANILVQANVIKPFIRLKNNHTTLKFDSRPNQSLKVSKIIELYNETNAQVDFKWKPVIGENGIAFSMRPASGTVSKHAMLLCELSFHPSISAPLRASFELETDGIVDSQILTCEMQIGNAEAQFHDRRINFGCIPLNIPTEVEVFLKNTSSQCPAIYRLTVPADIDGLELDPNEGVLQLCEIQRIKLRFRPQNTGKFDFSVTAQLRNGKSCSIRMGGIVEPPNVMIDVENFVFHSVPVGSRLSLPFMLRNEQNSSVVCTFDLKDEFSINSDPGNTEYTLAPKSARQLQLYFQPNMIASHEFLLPLLMNEIRTDLRPASGSSSRSTWERVSPTRSVVAAASQQALVIQPPNLKLSNTKNEYAVQFCNQSREEMKVSLLYDEIFNIYHNGIVVTDLLISPSAAIELNIKIKPTAGFHDHEIRIIQDEKYEMFLRTNYINDQPNIEFEPVEFFFETSPLDVFNEGYFMIKTYNMSFNSPLQLELPKMEADEQFEFEFLNDSDQDASRSEIEVKVKYKSLISRSAVKRITIKERDSEKRFYLNIHVSTDNSICSSYSFVAQTTENYQIARLKNTIQILPIDQPEASLTSSTPSVTPISVSRTPTSSEPTLKTSTMTTTSSSKQSERPIELGSTPSPNSAYVGRTLNMFYFNGIKKAVQKWFSTYGFPGGPFPIDIPQAVRKLSEKRSGLQRGSSRLVPGVRKELPTIYEMISHIAGARLAPVQVNKPLPEDEVNRALHLQALNNIFLEFVIGQGGQLGTIKPEFLMDWSDYVTFTKQKGVKKLNRDLFEATSEQAWTDFLLQLYKCVVLPKGLKTEVKDQQESNIYNQSETFLLNWMNTIYEEQRGYIWGSNTSARWIVNFDFDLMDSLVIATLLAHYAPFLIEKYLNKMYSDPLTPEQCLHNSLLILESMRELQIEFDLESTDITDPNPITMIILTKHLHDILPKYGPAGHEVVFDCQLGNVVCGSVVLHNKSRRAVTYRPKIINDNKVFEFMDPAQFKHLVIPAKSSTQLKITFKPRFLAQEKATLIVSGVNSVGGSKGGKTLSYNLVGNVTKIRSLHTIEIFQPLYQQTDIQLPVENLSMRSGMFKITLVEAVESQRMGFPLDQIRTPKQVSSTTEYPPIEEFFLSNENTVYLQKGEVKQLRLDYIPLLNVKKTCYVILKNDEIGEYISKVEASAPQPQNEVNLNPLQEEVIFWKCTNRTSNKLQIKIALQNNDLTAALHALAKIKMTTAEYERRKLTGTLENDSVIKRYLPASYINGDRKYKIDNASEKFGILSNILEFSSSDGILDVTLNAQESGRYYTTFVLRGFGHSILDHRIIKLEAIIPDGEEIKTINLEVSARDSISHEIPYYNDTPYVWNIQATYSGECFSGATIFRINPGESHYYQLTFKPNHELEYECSLKMTNLTDKMTEEFKLVGLGLEPKPRATLDFSQVQCYERRKGKVQLPSLSNYRRVKYSVSTSLPDLFDGKKEITTEPDEGGLYKFQIIPTEVKDYLGVLVFTGREMIKVNNPHYDSDDEFHGALREPELIEVPHGPELRLIYEVKINTIESNPASTITVECAVGSTTEATIDLFNPTESDILFAAEPRGDGLKGPKGVCVRAKSRAVYIYNFTGNRFDNDTAGRIYFSSSLTGEFWYLIKYKAINPPVVRLEPIVAEMGSWKEFQIPFTNISNTSASVNIETSNPNYVLDPNQSRSFTIEAKGTHTIPFIFVPVTLSNDGHDCVITMVSKEIGTCCFELTGNGLAPKTFETTRVAAKINTSITTTIPFRNPSNEMAYISVKLVDMENVKNENANSILLRSVTPDSTLQLILKRTDYIALRPNEVVDIPLSFTPEEFTRREAYMVVELKKASSGVWRENCRQTETAHDSFKATFDTLVRDDKGQVVGIRFIFPIIAQVESRLPVQKSPIIVCEARKRIEQRLELVLTGATPSVQPSARLRTVTPKARSNQPEQQTPTESINEYSHSIQFSKESFFSDSISIELVRKQHEADTGHVKLIFNFVFYPTVGGIEEIITISVNNIQGAEWIFPVKLDVREPRPDDVIKLPGCEIGQSSSVILNLYSPDTQPISFTAGLLTGSSSEFTLEPTDGYLLPDSSGGTQFKVTYSPQIYGKKCRARFMVNTPAQTWSYDVIGLNPIPRRKENLKVRLKQSQPKRQPPRNYLQENLKLIQMASSSKIKGIPLNAKPVY